MEVQLVLTVNSIENVKEDQFWLYRLQYLQMDNALRRQPIMVTLRCGMHRSELTLRHSNTPVAYIHWNSSPMANSHLVTGTSHHCGNVPRVFILSAISASDHSSSPYTDYDAFVILDHLHCILYTKVAVLVVRFSTSFTVDCF